MITIPTTPEEAKRLSDFFNNVRKALKELETELGIDFFEDKQPHQN